MKALVSFLFFIATLTSITSAEKPTQEELRAAIKENPHDTNALYNLAIQLYLKGDYKGAAKHWETIKKLDPNDWQVREKLIQTYWGSGNTQAAQSEIAELRAARKTRKYDELNKADFFICDQFQIDKTRAFVLEYYELKGEHPLAWKFILRNGDTKINHHYSVGNYSAATVGAINRGELGKDDTFFHLDGYWTNGSHTTYNLYKNRPNYQTVRKEVHNIMNGKQEPISSTVPQKSED